MFQPVRDPTSRGTGSPARGRRRTVGLPWRVARRRAVPTLERRKGGASFFHGVLSERRIFFMTGPEVVWYMWPFPSAWPKAVWYGFPGAWAKPSWQWRVSLARCPKVCARLSLARSPNFGPESVWYFCPGALPMACGTSSPAISPKARGMVCPALASFP